MTRDDRDYYGRRAEQELLAAALARNLEAARAHQALADHYASLACRVDPVSPSRAAAD